MTSGEVDDSASKGWSLRKITRGLYFASWLLFLVVQFETVRAVAMKPTVVWPDHVSAARTEIGLLVALHKAEFVAGHTIGTSNS